MALRVMKLSRWSKLNDVHPLEDPRAVNGLSPGGVAVELGISRQAVHQAIARGDLDAVKVVADHDPDRMVMFNVTQHSVGRYRQLREARRRATA